MVACQANLYWGNVLGHCPVSELRHEDFDKLDDSYSHLTNNSKVTYYAMLTSIFNFGVKRELISKNPMKTWKEMTPIRTSRRELTLTLEDLGKLIDIADEPLKFALQILWGIGVRPGKSELFTLRWDDINWKTKHIRVRGTKTVSSDRSLPLPDELFSILKERQGKAQTEYILEWKGKQVKDLSYRLQKALREADITYPVCLYNIRHLYASELIRNGAEIGAVASLLGHNTAQMLLKVYHHVLQGEKERAIQCLPSLK